MLSERIARIAEAVQLQALDGLVSVLRQERRLNDLGWLPHRTAPWAEIDAANDLDIPAILDRHYQDNWPNVRRLFEQHLDTYEIDDEAKATFREALAAHEAGLYRATTRTLFPEIERVSRIELHDGAHRSFASQKELQKWLRRLSPRDVAPAGRGGWELTKRLLKHLYEKVEAPHALAAMAADAVPNRHASVHGLISCPTRQNSINALIMTDFVFVVICAVKRQRNGAKSRTG